MPRTNRPLHSATDLDFGIDRADAEPIQSQIARQIRELVLESRLKPGAKLPSSRSLAEQLQVARATVVEAYEQLLGEGYVETRLGSGTRVAPELPETLLATGRKPAKTPAQTSMPHAREAARPFRSATLSRTRMSTWWTRAAKSSRSACRVSCGSEVRVLHRAI